MTMNWLRFGAIALSGAALIQACASPQAPNASAPDTESSTSAPATGSEAGTLAVRANGEDFVREGFVSKDGWEISFDTLYVNLADVTAYQTDPPFDPTAGTTLDAVKTVKAADVITIDLAAGDESAEPILIAELDAPAGRYNALSWQMVPASEGPAAGYTLVMQGTATKDGQSVDFNLQLDEELKFTCGDFVGDERKGILDSGGTADLEATFHFDHLFGDADAPMDDDLNLGALGFDPLAAIAQDGTLNADSSALQSQLSEAEYTQILGILPSLGHVGEGHCEEG